MPPITNQFCTQYNNPTWDWKIISTSLYATDILYWSRRRTLSTYRLSLRERPYLLFFDGTKIIDYTQFKGSFLMIFKPLNANITRDVKIACFPHSAERQEAYDKFKDDVVAYCNGSIKGLQGSRCND
jgi:hypothetical protein